MKILKNISTLCIVLILIFSFASACKYENRTSGTTEKSEEEEWTIYIGEILSVIAKYEDNSELAELIDKYENEQINITKKKLYAELIVEKYDEYIEESTKVYVPDIAKEHYALFLDYLMQRKQCFYYVAFTPVEKINLIEFSRLKDEAQTLYIKFEKETESMFKKFGVDSDI